MADSVAENVFSVTDSVHPIDLLQEALSTRIARHDEEVALVERQYHQLSKRIEDARARIKTSEADRKKVLQDLSSQTAQEVEKAFEDYHKGVRVLALAEQRFDELADRRADAKERLHVYRGDLELARKAAHSSRLKPAGAETAPFGNASRQVFQIIEEERTRVARHMHDGPAQSMSNLVLQAEILERLVDRPEAILAELLDFKNSVRKALEETRQLIFDLRPMTLDDLGLVPTLRKYIKEFGDKHGMNIRLSVVGEERRLPGNIEGTLFRIIQEALLNSQRHARSGNAEVALNISRERVLTIIRDDGEGFDIPEIEANLARNRQLGLISMRERADLEHGSFDLRSNPGKGTEIQVEFKLD